MCTESIRSVLAPIGLRRTGDRAPPRDAKLYVRKSCVRVTEGLGCQSSGGYGCLTQLFMKPPDILLISTRCEIGSLVWYYSPRRYLGRSPKWQLNYIGPFHVVGVLSAVNVAIQKSKTADRLLVHINKLQLYMGDASGAWVVDDSLDATDDSHTDSPIPPDFIRASIPATRMVRISNPNMRWEADRALLTIPPHPARA